MSFRKKVTFNELADKYSEVYRNEKTFQVRTKYYLEIFRKHFCQLKLREITPLTIEQFKASRRESISRHKKVRSNRTVNQELGILHQVLNKAVEWRMLEVNPFSKFGSKIYFADPGDRVRYLTEDEMKRLFDGLDHMRFEY